MNNHNTAVEVFNTFLKRIRDAKIPLISLRPREISEAVSYTGDYDLFIAPEYMSPLLKIVFELAVETQSSFTINRYKHGKAVLILHSQLDNQSIFVELWNMLSVKDPYNKTLRYILSERLQPHIVYSKNNSYSFSLEVEALYYASHLYSNGKKLTTELVQYRVEYYKEILEKFGSKYSVWYGELLSGHSDIKTVAHNANMALVELGILGMRNNIQGRFQEIRIKAAVTWNRIHRKFLQRLNTAPVVGPDGVGKTTLIESLIQQSPYPISYFRFKKLFRISPLYRVMFPWLRRSLTKELQGEIEVGKSEVDDKYGNFVILNALLFYPFRIIKNLIMNRFVFIDRYFHEYLLMNTRLPIGKAGLRQNWKMLLAWIPQPYWFIHLDAPTEVVHSRKLELREDAIVAYRQDIFRLCLESPPMVYSYINTQLPPEQCRDLLLKIANILEVKI